MIFELLDSDGMVVGELTVLTVAPEKSHMTNKETAPQLQEGMRLREKIEE